MQRQIFALIPNRFFYVQRTGCQGEMMPHNRPTYTTVYGYFQKWQRLGIWQQLRPKLGPDEQSTVAIADSQSVKTTEKRGKSTVSRWQEG
jgi:putative transposase